jgi:indoleamine 2,3-dioxygenase
MFPNGVIYEGVSPDNTPTFYRGESGANDSIVPTLDNFLQVTEKMPQNPLTEILRDFRSYRPANHNAWLAWLEKRSRDLKIREYALGESNSAVLYLALLDQLREFRGRHWNFTKEYIIKHTRHPVATGGSPITTWLPNQLGVVLGCMVEAGKSVKQENLTPYHRALSQELTARAEAQARILEREVKELKGLFKDQDVASA